MAGSGLTADHAKYTNEFRPIHFRVFGVVGGRNARPGSVAAVAAAAISTATVPATVKSAVSAMMSAVKAAASMMMVVPMMILMSVMDMVRFRRAAGTSGVRAPAKEPQAVRRAVEVLLVLVGRCN